MVYYMTDFALALCFIIAIGYLLAYCFNLSRFERFLLPISGGIVFALCFVVSHMIARLFI